MAIFARPSVRGNREAKKPHGNSKEVRWVSNLPEPSQEFLFTNFHGRYDRLTVEAVVNEINLGKNFLTAKPGKKGKITVRHSGSGMEPCTFSSPQNFADVLTKLNAQL